MSYTKAKPPYCRHHGRGMALPLAIMAPLLLLTAHAWAPAHLPNPPRPLSTPTRSLSHHSTGGPKLHRRYSVATTQLMNTGGGPSTMVVGGGADHLLVGFHRIAGEFFSRLVEWATDEEVEQGELRLAHDDIASRPIDKQGRVLSIPRAERYSTSDWLHNVLNMHSSRTLAGIKSVVLSNAIWTFLVAFIFKQFRVPALPLQPHSLLGSFLGLLLVFRTNASYARFWEGRQAWENILNKTRDLTRMVMLYKDAMGADKVSTMARLLMGFSISLHSHLTGVNREEFLEHVLGTDLFYKISTWNRPLDICNRMAVLLRNTPNTADFNSRERLTMMAMVHDLSHHLGTCERIVQTPVPLSYARHTSRFLTLWLWSLPFGLVGLTGYYSVIIMTFMAWALFGILEIGIQIEDPFPKQLKLEVLTRTNVEAVQETVSSMSAFC